MQILISRTILSTAGRTIARFPFVLICAIAATIILVIIVGLPNNDDEQHRTLVKTIMSLYLGMLFSISSTIFCERSNISRLKQYVLNVILLLPVLLYYYSLPKDPGYVVISRFILLILAGHALVSFVPFLSLKPNPGFWQYNKLLFIRILTALFYAHALFAGLSLAILAIDNLFVLHFDDITYPRLYFIVIGIFNTLFFLSGIPEDVEAVEQLSDYPKGLKIFTQFILLPLVTIYLLILYAYSLKILFTQEWPVGWVSYLVIGFSVAGILALLLVWPLRNDEKHKWISTYIRYFYLALFPLIALLFIAIGKRVQQYGVTEDRYFIIIVAIWLLLMALYFLFSKAKNIKVIPATLFFFCLFSAYGPFSAYRIAEKSQLNRLKSLLQNNDHLKNGMAVRSDNKISKEDVNEISSASYYLINTHGLESVQPIFQTNLDSLCSKKDSSVLFEFKAATVLSTIGIEYSNQYDQGANIGRHAVYSTSNNEVLITKDFDFLVSFNIPLNKKNNSKYQVFPIGADSIMIGLVDSTSTITFRVNDCCAVSLNLLNEVNKLNAEYGFEKYDLPPQKMQYDFENGGVRFRLIINNINSLISEQSYRMELYNLSGQLLIKRE